MKKCLGVILLIVLGGFLFAADQSRFEPLPVPMSNNAVASVKSRGSLLLYSMMGMGPKKTWDAISNSGYMLDSEADTGKWAEVRAVPGTQLAADASVHSHGVLGVLGTPKDQVAEVLGAATSLNANLRAYVSRRVAVIRSSAVPNARPLTRRMFMAVK